MTLSTFTMLKVPEMIDFRDTLKRIPGSVRAVRQARRLRRRMRTGYLKRRHPEGTHLTCHGVDVYCNFDDPTYEWYDRRAQNLLLDQRIIELLIEQGDGDLFLDLGAHFGYFSAFLTNLLAAQGRPATIIAVEPDIDNFHCLQQTIALGEKSCVSHELLQMALAATNGTATLHRNGVSCLNTYRAPGGERCYEVEAITLDSIVQRFGRGKTLNLIKIDIDGPEPLLFRGGKATLKEHCPNILMEFCPSLLRAFGEEPRQFFLQLCRDYHVYWLHYTADEIRNVHESDYEEIVAAVGGSITDFVISRDPLRLGRFSRTE